MIWIFKSFRKEEKFQGVYIYFIYIHSFLIFEAYIIKQNAIKKKG